jgi:hypothetical protein
MAGGLKHSACRARSAKQSGMSEGRCEAQVVIDHQHVAMRARLDTRAVPRGGGFELVDATGAQTLHAVPLRRPPFDHGPGFEAVVPIAAGRSRAGRPACRATAAARSRPCGNHGPRVRRPRDPRRASGARQPLTGSPRRAARFRKSAWRWAG